MFETAILKIASRCNINCTYCYMYHGADQAWRTQPVRMSIEILSVFFERLRSYIESSNLSNFHIVLHGGEPLMAGREFFDAFIAERNRTTSISACRITCSVQTNGLLLNNSWIELFSQENIRVGVSLDGPAHLHDEFRKTKKGQGTHSAVETIIKQFTTHDQWSKCFGGTLTVVNPKSDGAELVRYLYDLKIPRADLLLPDENFDYPVHTSEQRTALGRVLCDAYVEWRQIDDPAFRIGLFENLVRFFLTGELPRSDDLGGNPIGIFVLETSGALEPLDVFKCCGREFTQTNTTVFDSSFDELLPTLPFQAQLHPDKFLGEKCLKCAHVPICGGGYLPHRLKQGQLRNESIYCQQLYELIDLVKQDIRSNGVVQNGNLLVN